MLEIESENFFFDMIHRCRLLAALVTIRLLALTFEENKNYQQDSDHFKTEEILHKINIIF